MKPNTEGRLLAEVIAAVANGSKGLSIPAPEPVPADVLAALAIADGVAPSPSLRAWLAFDGSWIAREFGWFDDPQAPAFRALPIHAVVHDHNSKVFAPAFVDLPGQLAGALALPLDAGSDSMRMLALVAGPDGEFPVIYIDTDDCPLIGIEAPSFAVWLAERAGLVGDLRRDYAAQITRVGKHFFGGKTTHVELHAAGPEGDAYEALLAGDRAATEAFRARLAGAFSSGKTGAKRKTPAVPELAEGKLGAALAQAIEGGRKDRVDAFLAAAEARFPKGKKWRDPALVAAVADRDAALVGRLLRGGANPNVRSYLQNTVVHAAAEHEEPTILSLLLAAGGDVAKRGYSGQTPLFDACGRGFLAGVRVLLAAGADPNARDSSKRTPLIETASTSEPERLAATLEIARALLDAGADANATTQGTALHAAIDRQNAALAALLMERGADIEAVDWAGKNALHAAWSRGDLVTFDRLAGVGRRDLPIKKGPRLDELIQGDGLLPAQFELRLQCRAEPQAVTLRVRLERGATPTTDERWADDAAASLATLAAAGFLGSDVFAPEAGVGVALGPAEKAKKSTGSFVERRVRMTLGGVSPAGLAFWLRGVRAAFAPVTLELVGEVPLSGALAFDAVRAEGALRDPSREPLAAYPGRASIVVDRRDRALLARAWPSGRGALLGPYAYALGMALRLVPTHEKADLRVRSKPMLVITSENGGAWETQRMGSGGLSARSVALARRLFENAVARLVANGEVGDAEWCP